MNRGFDVFQLIHELFINMQSPGCIDEDRIAQRHWPFDGLLGNRHRGDLTAHGKDWHVQFLSNDFELGNGSGTINVTSNHERLLSIFAEVIGQLSDGSILPAP